MMFLALTVSFLLFAFLLGSLYKLTMELWRTQAVQGTLQRELEKLKSELKTAKENVQYLKLDLYRIQDALARGQGGNAVDSDSNSTDTESDTKQGGGLGEIQGGNAGFVFPRSRFMGPRSPSCTTSEKEQSRTLIRQLKAHLGSGFLTSWEKRFLQAMVDRKVASTQKQLSKLMEINRKIQG